MGLPIGIDFGEDNAMVVVADAIGPVVVTTAQHEDSTPCVMRHDLRRVRDLAGIMAGQIDEVLPVGWTGDLGAAARFCARRRAPW
jgi:molecular chaperone DnaK (HSP70)